jgi:hypothetical protein
MGSKIFVSELKFSIKPKRFLSALQIFGPKAFVLFCLQNLFQTTESSVLPLKRPRKRHDWKTDRQDSRQT